MNDRHLKLKDAIEVVRETVADEYIESTLELRLLDKSLTADVVEVVRCKDCKNRIFDKSRNLFYCQMYYGMGNVSDNNYCSYGERADK